MKVEISVLALVFSSVNLISGLGSAANSKASSAEQLSYATSALSSHSALSHVLEPALSIRHNNDSGLVNLTGLVPQDGRPLRALAGKPFTIVLVGDSTVATGGGWGPGFCATLTSNVTCDDLAVNGRSSKSYVDEGLWQKALDRRGQYYLIQFGHNDQKDDPKRHTDPETTYAANLDRFVREVRGIGAIPVLVTPLSRRNYKEGKLEIDALAAYAAAVRRVGLEDKVAVIDLYAHSTELLRGMTQQQADALDATDHPDAKAENGATAKPDRTHLNGEGKALFGRMVADQLVLVQGDLRPDIKNDAQKPATPIAVAPDKN